MARQFRPMTEFQSNMWVHSNLTFLLCVNNVKNCVTTGKAKPPQIKDVFLVCPVVDYVKLICWAMQPAAIICLRFFVFVYC